VPSWPRNGLTLATTPTRSALLATSIGTCSDFEGIAPYFQAFLARAYLGKALGDPAFRATLPNALRYLLSRRDVGVGVLARLTRRSY